MNSISVSDDHISNESINNDISGESSDLGLKHTFDEIDTVDKQVIVKYYLESNKKLLFTNSYSPDYSIASIKKHIERFFNIPFINIFLKIGDKVLENDEQIGDYESDNFGVLEVTIVFTNINLKLEPEDVSQLYQNVPPVLPDVLTVQVPTEDKGVYNVVVEVENKCIYKPNLGGYKNVFSGIEYHNAYSQTGPNIKPSLVQNHRDTQTSLRKNKKTNECDSKSTQLGFTSWFPELTDKILTAKPYETAEEREKRLDIPGKVRYIQRCYRAWVLRKRVQQLSVEYKSRLKLQQVRDATENLENEERIRRDLVNKAFPVNSGDFDMLYSMIERWKKAEIQRISMNFCGPAKIVEFQILLDKEIELLHSIDKVRQQVSDEIETQKIISFFKAIGMPVKWTSEYKNITIEMDTLETQKGREYFHIYKSLCDQNMEKQEKIALYVDLKNSFINHKCPTGLELNKLIDRMIAILVRNMGKTHYMTVEKMIQKLMFHHFQEPECNEGVTARMSRLKEKSMENKLICCKRCNKLKVIDKFLINARMNKTNICSACHWLDKSEDPLVDLSPYKYILKQIRKFEPEHRGSTSVAFIVTVNDIYHIVDNIWHKKSALSECNDIYQLRLIRWNIKEQWSPWNCIPLTTEEAKLHVTIKHLEDVYSEHLISVVTTKHALAKIQFKHLIFVENKLEKTLKT